MNECTCTKPIGEDMAKGQVPEAAAAALEASGLFRVSGGGIQYGGGVGTSAKNEVGHWESPEICPVHAAPPGAVNTAAAPASPPKLD